MHPRGKPTLADVDGTTLGKVQLVSLKLVEGFGESPELMHTYFEEGAGRVDPWLQAEGLKRGIEDDWPEHYWAIVGNWRAMYLAWVRRMRGLGFLSEEDWSPSAYLETFSK
jgi:hypothetical protein